MAVSPRPFGRAIVFFTLLMLALIGVAAAVLWFGPREVAEPGSFSTPLPGDAAVTAATAALSRQLEVNATRLDSLAVATQVLNRHSGTAGFYSNLRELVLALVHATLENERGLARVYAVWMPNAVDAQDEVFAEDLAWGSNAAGRFASYWTRVDGDIVGDILTEAELGSGDFRQWQTCVQNQQAPCLLAGKDGLTLVIALRDGNEVQGFYAGQWPLAWWQPRLEALLKELPAASAVQLWSLEGEVIASAGEQVRPGEAVAEPALWLEAPLGGVAAGWTLAVR